LTLGTKYDRKTRNFTAIAVISVIAIIVLLNVLVAWFHYNALVVLPRTSPVSPVWMWLMIIPIVHTVFIWIISAFKLPASYRSALGENAHRFGSCNQRLGLAWAIMPLPYFYP
jgi:hypothetical protein